MIVVAGESLVDLLVEPDGQVSAALGGAPYNVARGLGRLGAEVTFLGAISSDPFGRMLRAALAEDGVDPRGLVDSPLATLLAVAELGGGGAKYRFHTADTAAPSLTAADVAAVMPERVDALLVGALGLVLEPMASALEELVARSDPRTLVMVDPNWRPSAIVDDSAYRARLQRVLGRADIVKVSTEDLEHMAPGAPMEDTARGLLSGQVRCVLVTAGSEPVRVLTARGERSVPSPEIEVVDTVGAGDAFCAGLIAWWTASERPAADLGDPDVVARAAAFAARVAAITCERSGADPPWAAEVGGLPAPAG